MASAYKIWGLGMVAHICNPRYSGSRDQEDFCLRPTLGKKFARPHLLIEKMGILVCNFSYLRGIRLECSSPDWPGQP
jgi:hypothetical protein